ncbi:MAG: AsmA-like C-terminal region-containing protein [Rhizobiaceae bacterium]
MKFFAFVGSLLVIALLAALILPPYVDWNQFKSRFEAEASLTLGLPVTVNGQTSARLLPLPSVTFTDIEIGSSEGKPAVLVADSFKIDVELAPLMKGNVVIVDMQLNNPTVNFEIDEKGQLEFPEIDQQRPELRDANVSLENISIENGTVNLTDVRYDRAVRLEGVSAEASARTLRGPWQVDGFLSHNEERYRIGLSTGSWQQQGSIRLTIDVEPQSFPYDFEFNGPLVVREGMPAWSGRLKIKPMGPQSDEDLIVFRRPGQDQTFPIRLESELQIVSGGATAPAFELDIGSRDDPYKLTGNGQAVFTEQVSFRLRAEGQQVNVERFSAGQEQGQDFSSRLETLKSFLTRIPQFDADGEINLYLPAVVAGDTVIREVGMDLRPAPLGAGWQVNNLEAQLPGRTEMRADGQLLLGETLGYQGEFLLASQQPSGFAKWLGAPADSAIRDLAEAGFSAKTVITGELVEFNEVELILDKAKLTGSIRREKPSDGRARLVTKLAGDTVDFDELNGLFELFSLGGEEQKIAAHDLDLDLNAGSLAFANLEARDVTAKVKLEQSRLMVDQLTIGDIAGANISLNGQLQGLADQPQGKLVSTFTSAKPARFLETINKRFGPYPIIGHFIESGGIIRDSALELQFEAGQEGYELVVTGKSGGSDIDARLAGNDVSVPLDQQEVDAKLIVVSERASDLLAQFGLPVIPLVDSGRAAMRLEASGVSEQGLKTDATLTLSRGYIGADGTLKPIVDGENISFYGVLKLNGEFEDMDTPILMSGIPFPGFGEGLAGEFNTLLTVNGTRFLAQEVAGRLGASEFSGNGSVDLARQPRPMVRGDLSISDLDAAKLAGLVYTRPAGNVSTNALATDDATGSAVSNQPVFSGIDARIKVRSDRVGMFETFPDVTNAAANLSVRDGDMSFDSLNAQWMGGLIEGEFAMAQTSAARSLNGQLSIKDADVAGISALSGLPEGLSGQLTMGGTFEATGKDWPSMLSQLTASGSLKLTGGQLAGLSGTAFPAILTAADATSDEEVADSAETLLQSQLGLGRFAFESAELPFNIAGGTLRVNGLRLNNDFLQISGNGRYDLTSGQSQFEATLAFDPGKEVVVGASPEFDIALAAADGALNYSIDPSLFSTYLGMRLSERREREFEAQRAEILERQRLQQVARVYALQEEVRRIAEAERERIRLLEIQQEEQRRRELARRIREELERKRIEAEIEAAEKRAAREAALEAGRRERRQLEIDLLKKQAEEAAERIQRGDFDPVE